MIHQHAPAAEAHHAEAALEHEALIVSGRDPGLEGFGAADPISLLGLPLWVVHPLHVLSQFVLSLELLATGGAQEIFAVRVPQHVESQLVGAAESLVTLCTLVNLLRMETAHMFLDLDKIWEAFLAGGAGEITIIDMDGHMILKQIQAVKGLRAENAGVCFLVHVELHVALKGTAVDEALVADVTGQRAVPFPPMEPQVLVQLVLLPEGLPTLQAFERAEGFPDEQVLQSCIPDALCSPHVICCHSALRGHCVPLVLWLYMEHMVFLLLQCCLWLCWHWSLFLLLQPIQWGLSGLIKLPFAGKMQQVLCSFFTFFNIFTGYFHAHEFGRAPRASAWSKSPLSSPTTSTSGSAEEVQLLVMGVEVLLELL